MSNSAYPKNGYEIRAALIESARHFHENILAFNQAQYENAVALAKKVGEATTNVIPVPKVPTFEDILNTAQKWNDFVSGNKTTENKAA